VRSRPGAARTILLSHIICARPSKQPLMVRTFLKVYMELGFFFLFLQEQIKDIIIIRRQMILTRSLRILTLTLIKFSFFFLCFLWESYRDCFHDFSFSFRFLEVSHVEGSSLTTSLRYQDLLSFL